MKTGVHNIEDLVTKLSKIPPTFLRDFLSPEEEHTLFLNDLEEEFLVFFFPAISMFSQRKLAKITDYLQGSSQNQFSQFSEPACSIQF